METKNGRWEDAAYLTFLILVIVVYVLLIIVFYGNGCVEWGGRFFCFPQW